MRKFEGRAVVEPLQDGAIRLRIKNSTGEEVCKDFTPAEIDDLRTAIGPAKPIPTPRKATKPARAKR